MVDRKPSSGRARPTRRGFFGWLGAFAGGVLAACRAAAVRPTDELDWRALEEALAGRLVPRSAAGYEADRVSMVWNGWTPRRFPAAIVHAANEEDVRATLRFASQRGLRVSVRGGGHQFDGIALRAGTILLDLGGLKRVSVDAEARTAVVEPGVTGAALIDALAPHGLAFPVGHCAQVTTSGFLLSGGFGWNGGSWGPAAASVRGVDVVTSTGASLHASATSHPELFWAVRGAGLLCPVAVVRFHLDLHPLPRAIRTSTLTFQVEDAAAAAAWLETARAQCPPEVELVALATAPLLEARAKGAPERVFVASATAFADTESDAARWLAPFERGPERPAPLARAPLVETPFRALFASIAAAFPENACYAVDHLWSRGPAADVLAATQALAAAPASPSDLLLVGFGPAPRADAPPLPDMALAVPGQLYVAVYGVAADPARAEASRAWMRSVVVALAPYRAGRYVGEASAERAASCFSPEAQRRLAEVTRQYDPRGTLGGAADA